MNDTQRIQEIIGVETDGKFGPKSRAALDAATPEQVKQVQHIIGTAEDGKWGPKSEAALQKTINPKQSGLSDELRASYQKDFDSTEVKPSKIAEVDSYISRLMRGEKRYRAIQDATGVPWYVTALIHGLEADFDFNKHLYNGDPLKRRTVNVPRGRPKEGNPPFEFEQAAVSALKYDGFTDWKDWSVPGILYMLERYNGWGYRKLGKQNPYLWSYSNHYDKGKFTSDGHYSSSVVSKQVGAGTALFQMIHQNLIKDLT